MNTYVKGLVSVIIPTYKRSDMLLRAINSVIEQSYDSIEIIIVNDNIPNDDFSIKLYKILSKIKDNRLKLIEQDEHINGAAARNCGIKKAKGEYLAFLDDDDWWDKDKLKIQVSVLAQLDDKWAGVTCLKKYYKNSCFFRASLPYRDGDIFENVILLLTNITTGTVLLRHSVLDNVGYFDERLKRHQDTQLFSYISQKYKIKLIQKHLLNIDVSDNQNRPSSKNIKSIKYEYMQSVNKLLINNHRLRDRLQAHLDLGIAIAYIRNGNVKESMPIFCKVIKSPKVIIERIHVYVLNIFEILLKNYILNKYTTR